MCQPGNQSRCCKLIISLARRQSMRLGCKPCCSQIKVLHSHANYNAPERCNSTQIPNPIREKTVLTFFCKSGIDSWATFQLKITCHLTKKNKNYRGRITGVNGSEWGRLAPLSGSAATCGGAHGARLPGIDSGGGGRSGCVLPVQD
jgi:hypothetical protein